MIRNVMSYPRAARFEDAGEGFVAEGPRERPPSQEEVILCH